MKLKYWTSISGDMFDFEGFYSRVANELPNNCTIAEVGVADGKSALMLADELVSLGKSFTLYMIDSLDYGGKEQLITIVNHAIEAGISGVRVWPYSSLEAVEKFPDNHFDFVFIDSSHLYEDTKLEIPAWLQKIKEDGILAGHDYLGHEQVKRAVDEIVPKEVTRTDIPNRKFKPEGVLQIEDTSKHFGVWWFKKKFYIKLL